MVFSSISFLYYFLPIVLGLYFLVTSKFRNMVLLVASLFFYFYGEPRYILVLLFSCVFNYYFGKYLEKKNGKLKKRLLIVNLIVNFSLLFYFKYFNFFIENINRIFNSSLSFINVVMPIGISFFTFQATSYVIDIYRGRVKSASNVLEFMTYLSLFPQLIAGPIVRYDTISEEMKNRKCSFSDFSLGVKRFIIGLSKKVLIANVLGEFSKSLIELSDKSVLSYWLKAISDTLQIYFDFSGYSDMAIGIGLMLGFHFLENFNYPFVSRSITEFWRRWHISLSSWFKDYVYIPLGGSRCGEIRRYLNIFIVWMATGFWHGASWNFILWGLYFAIILIIEKKFLLKYLDKSKILSRVYAMFLVIISFVIFNANNLINILVDLKGMFGMGDISFLNVDTIYFLKNYIVILIIGIIGSVGIVPSLFKKMSKNKIINLGFRILEPVIYIGLLLLVTGFIVDESFNPFLYFRF